MLIQLSVLQVNMPSVQIMQCCLSAIIVTGKSQVAQKHHTERLENNFTIFKQN